MAIDDNVLDFEGLTLNLTSDEEGQIIRLFLSSKDEHDDLNYRIAANAVRGFKTIEHDEYGVPLEMLAKLDLWGQIALFAGIGMINEKVMRDLSGLSFGKQIKNLTKHAYVSGGRDFAANALFVMKSKRLSYNSKKSGSVEEMMDTQTEEVKLQVLRSFYIPKIVNHSFPPRGEYQRLFSSGIKRQNLTRPDYDERENAIRHLLQLLKTKEPKPYTINPKGTFKEGWIVPVEDKKGKREYFVQRNVVYVLGLTNGEMEVYHCNCPFGWSKLISSTPRSLAKGACRHVKEVQLKYVA